jgi:hypothetical protein
MPKTKRRKKVSRSKPIRKAKPRVKARPKARAKAKAKARPRKVAASRGKPAPQGPQRGPRRIKVPKTPKSAYDPDRPISELVKNQIRHMQAAEQSLPAESRSLMPVAAITTERDASAYLQHVTEQLHPAAYRGLTRAQRKLRPGSDPGVKRRKK